MDKSQGNCKNQEDQSFFNEEQQEEETVASGCLCNLSRFTWWRSTDIDGKFLLNHTEEKQKESSWLGQKLKSVKDASEVLAGPKWKNLIRKLVAYFSQGNKCKKARFQYDPHSYALNFDDPAQGDNDRLFGFSARFAPSLKHDHRLSDL